MTGRRGDSRNMLDFLTDTLSFTIGMTIGLYLLKKMGAL